MVRQVTVWYGELCSFRGLANRHRLPTNDFHLVNSHRSSLAVLLVVVAVITMPTAARADRVAAPVASPAPTSPARPSAPVASLTPQDLVRIAVPTALISRPILQSMSSSVVGRIVTFRLHVLAPPGGLYQPFGASIINWRCADAETVPGRPAASITHSGAFDAYLVSGTYENGVYEMPYDYDGLSSSANYRWQCEAVDVRLTAANGAVALYTLSSQPGANPLTPLQFTIPLKIEPYPGGFKYVALGDSFSAGEGIEPFFEPTNGCHRSHLSYPALVRLPGYVNTTIKAARSSTSGVQWGF